MSRLLARALFYGGTVVVVIIMTQDFFRRFLVSILGDTTGGSLFDFLRTNVSAPVTLIALALYLDLALGQGRAANAVGRADLRTRRAIYVTLLIACMPLSGWAGTHDAWQWLTGDDIGASLYVFFDRQVETYVSALLLALILDVVYGLRWGDGGWSWAPRGPRARLVTYAGLLGLALVCAARGPVGSVLEMGLPDDVAGSLAQYFRRALEGVLVPIGVMAFLDLVRPGGLGLVLGPYRSVRPSTGQSVAGEPAKGVGSPGAGSTG